MAEALEGQKDGVVGCERNWDFEAFGPALKRKPMADRLRLTDKRIAQTAGALREGGCAFRSARGHAEDVDEAQRDASRARAGADRRDWNCE